MLNGKTVDIRKVVVVGVGEGGGGNGYHDSKRKASWKQFVKLNKKYSSFDCTGSQIYPITLFYSRIANLVV